MYPMGDREGRMSPGAEGAHGRSHVQGHDLSCRPDSRPKSVPPFDPDALISARGLGMTRNGRDLLIDVDLDILEREIVTLIGPNGAGKTTLVRVLLGLEKPDCGEVRRRKDLRVGYVPQRFDIDSVIPMTVARFLRLGGDEPPDAETETPANNECFSLLYP